jgi:hypothetical protein
MAQILTEESDPVVRARVPPARTWAGALVDSAHRVTHYLHLSAFPCAHCNGPVIAGQMGTREDDITRETEVRGIGAVCLFCGRRPAAVPEPLVAHRFRPIEWKWMIKQQAGPLNSGDDPLTAELSQDADTPVQSSD